MDIQKTLLELSNLTGISGHEDELCTHIAEKLQLYCDEVYIDPFFNVIALKKGIGSPKKRVLCMAHMDEIGFVVNTFEDLGFIRISPIGGIDTKILPASEVIIHGKKKIFGVIGAKPPHLQKSEDSKKSPQIHELLVDTGYSTEELKKWVQIGDPITFYASQSEHIHHRISSKSLDNRAGVATLIQTAALLSSIKHENDILFVASVQEEVGLRGSMMASFEHFPDMGMVVDVGFGEFPEGPKQDVYALGKGPAIGIGPNLHRKCTKKIIQLAIEHNIPYQIDTEPGNTGTEAWAMQVTKTGIPTLLLSIPLRYMHTPIEMVQSDDVKETASLMAKWCALKTHELEECLCI